MTVSLLDVLVSGRPDRSPLHRARRGATGGLLAVTVLCACLAGRRPGRRR
jgi:hypothetical protein